MTDESIMDLEMYDLESSFEPLTRTRSNTWPMPQPVGYIDGPLINGLPMTDSNEFMKIDISTQENHSVQIVELPLIKKKTSRRNAWGNLSYAELITLAINSVKDQRLTLSQIYTWMVKNIPFFKDKGDSNSSAGWKNSVRHNLSLHNRFIRVPNEGAGKSSWWMINPNAKSGKSTRRRAASMEAGKCERKRSRVRKKVEILKKNNLQINTISSPISSKHMKIDLTCLNTLPTTKKVKSLVFPSRIWSLSSSSGKFSPIPATSDETEWSSEYSYTLKQAAASQIEITQPILVQHTQESSSYNNGQVDISSAHYQTVNNISISNDTQMIPVTYTLAQSIELCPIHQQGYCTCSVNIVQICNTLPKNETESYVLLEGEQANPFFLDSYENQQYNITASQLTLKSTQETNQNSSTSLLIDNNIENQTTNTPLVRNNSLLDDIDEIIKREQYTSVDIVNDSMSAALYISKNIKNHPWIH